MKNTLILAALVLVVVIGVVLIYAAGQPDQFRVTRTAVIDEARVIVFDLANDPKKAHAWSPWVEMEPDAHYQFSGASRGEGAITAWEGKKVGKGMAEIVESRPPEFIRTRLDFEKPMKAVNTVEFKFERQGGKKTKVTWTMYGPNTFMGKVMGLFMDCEKMIGDQFEQGLENLNEAVKTQRL